MHYFKAVSSTVVLPSISCFEQTSETGSEAGYMQPKINLCVEKSRQREDQVAKSWSVRTGISFCWNCKSLEADRTSCDDGFHKPTVRRKKRPAGVFCRSAQSRFEIHVGFLVGKNPRGIWRWG